MLCSGVKFSPRAFWGRSAPSVNLGPPHIPETIRGRRLNFDTHLYFSFLHAVATFVVKVKCKVKRHSQLAYVKDSHYATALCGVV